jgi:hypothetical protein
MSGTDDEISSYLYECTDQLIDINQRLVAIKTLVCSRLSDITFSLTLLFIEPIYDRLTPLLFLLRDSLVGVSLAINCAIQKT